jgi:hypothetical protein
MLYVCLEIFSINYYGFWILFFHDGLYVFYFFLFCQPICFHFNFSIGLLTSFSRFPWQVKKSHQLSISLIMSIHNCEPL